MVCEKCKADIPDTAKFCPFCGAGVEMGEKAQETKSRVDGHQFQKAGKEAAGKSKDVVYCPQCGTENRPTAKFCKKDGAPLGKAVELPPSQQEFMKASPPETEEVRKPSNSWILVAVLSLFFVIVGYLYFAGQKTVEHPEEAPTQKGEEIVDSPAGIARLERDINNALRNRGLNEVYADVNKDLLAVLKGTVNDPRDKMLAERITESFEEINEVRNSIVVKTAVQPKQKKAPIKQEKAPIDIAKLERDINSALRRNSRLRGVHVNVDSNLKATLEGRVADLSDKMRAEEITRSFGEIKVVRNYIVVKTVIKLPPPPPLPRR